MKEPLYRNEIEKMYGAHYKIEFDKDRVEKLKERTQILRSIIRIGGGISASILLLIFLFLLFGYARERSDIYRLFQMLGITTLFSRFVLLFEPLLLVSFGILLGYVTFRYIEMYVLSRLTHLLLKKGIDFPLLVANTQFVVILSLILFSIILFLILIVDAFMRKKQWI